ncbi:hypothetical protein PoB_004824600 [Plakobranchus ocellatus]|uniref:Uncharacterized protein n=1 Tax=Plakobranchus ocellatus TaxID=259542 RepID=A0AAV4BMQ7_9GAST|nr:hypothetical protein PoB_004824600 [Plakobranchus ocellatus]
MAFETEDDLTSELRNWFDNLDVDFFRVGINSLLSRWQKCINLHKSPTTEDISSRNSEDEYNSDDSKDFDSKVERIREAHLNWWSKFCSHCVRHSIC